MQQAREAQGREYDEMADKVRGQNEAIDTANRAIEKAQKEQTAYLNSGTIANPFLNQDKVAAFEKDIESMQHELAMFVEAGTALQMQFDTVNMAREAAADAERAYAIELQKA